MTYRVEQLATVDTTIAGNNQKTKLRTASVRTLTVTSVSEEGHITFEHVINNVDLWSEVAGRKPVRYNSETDEQAPEEFAAVSKMIGVPISEITISAHGKVLHREDKVRQQNLGMGGLSIPFPEEAIAIDHKWSIPQTVQIQLQNKQIKNVKTRELYTLKNVSAGVATISIQTQVLTPISDPKIRSQLIQRLSSGTIRFDIDSGRLLSKELIWDENVLGFSGPDSNMKYLAKFTEKLESDPVKKTAAKSER